MPDYPVYMDGEPQIEGLSRILERNEWARLIQLLSVYLGIINAWRTSQAF
jgi:hypothetical protein